MTRCLVVQSHHLNQCWFIINQSLKMHFNQTLLQIKSTSLKKMHLKMLLRDSQPFCTGSTLLNQPLLRLHHSCCENHRKKTSVLFWLAWYTVLAQTPPFHGEFGLSLVAIRLSVGYETWPPIGWHHSFVIGWSKYRLGLPSASLRYGLSWLLGIPTIFQTAMTFLLHSPNGS